MCIRGISLMESHLLPSVLKRERAAFFGRSRSGKTRSDSVPPSAYGTTLETHVGWIGRFIAFTASVIRKTWPGGQRVSYVLGSWRIVLGIKDVDFAPK